MPFDPSEPSPIPTLPNTSWPTDNQLSGIGAVAVVWSWLEMALETLLCTLSQSDEALTQALTADLGADNRIKALRRLATTWERILRPDQHAPLIVELRSIAVWLARNKSRRNTIVHSLWIRNTDAAMFGWKHSTMPVGDDHLETSSTLSRDDALAFAREAGAIVGRLLDAERAARSLPVLRAPSPDTQLPLGVASLLGPLRNREVP